MDCFGRRMPTREVCVGRDGEELAYRRGGLVRLTVRGRKRVCAASGFEVLKRDSWSQGPILATVEGVQFRCAGEKRFVLGREGHIGCKRVMAEQREFRLKLAAEVEGGVARCAAVRSEGVNKSHWDYWLMFLRRTGRSFLCLEKPFGLDPLENRRLEEEILLPLVWFVAKYPRSAGKKKKKVENSLGYAKRVALSVRAAAERRLGRQVGTARLSVKPVARTRAVYATLAREGPLPRKARRPIMKRELLLVRENLDLRDSQLDRVGCAVALTLFFGVLRVGDVLGAEPKDRIWNPDRRTHRSRLLASIYASD